MVLSAPPKATTLLLALLLSLAMPPAARAIVINEEDGDVALHVEDSGAADHGDGSDQDDFEQDDKALQASVARPYEVRTAPSRDLALKPPTLPDLSPYTHEAVLKKIERKGRPSVAVERMLEKDPFRGFMGGDNRLREWASRQSALPRAIFIHRGYVTAQELAKRLPANVFAETEPGVFVARLPINVGPQATLHIDGSVKDFRLSLDRGSFLVVEGKLFITDSRLRGWNEAKKAPSEYSGDKGKAFRPFLVSWGGSETYISKSVVANLGYAASKSYGVSISQFSPGMTRKMNRPPPQAWLLDSEFYDNWYGFYCYEADDLVILRNDYHDNIVYGIDPHDRSHRLIIADNLAYRTKYKHGIIVSREVNDSWIFNNKAYDNGLSGIVIDRSSVDNLVAHNQVFRNKSDGITIYESPRTLIWQNLVSGNRRHGIRVRNSTGVHIHGNVAVGNRLAGVYGHVKDLRGTGRNLRLDPFHERISMTVVGGQLVSNGSGPVTIDQPLSLELYNVDLRAPQRELGFKFTGVLGKYQEEVLDLLLRHKEAVVIKPAGEATPKQAAHSTRTSVRK